jgi:amino acid transporter
MSADPPALQRRAGLLAAVGLLYASACGGPYGTENYVATTGPGLLVALLVLAAGLWGVPLALATAELSARRPIEGGYYRWVRDYMGDFWGYQAGVWSLFSSVLDNALYPVLFASALEYWIPGLGRGGRWLAATLFVWILIYLNVRGIRLVGFAAVGLNAFLIAPLVVLILAALGRWQFNPLLPWTANGSVLDALGAGLPLAVWFHSGYAEVSTAGEEIDDPRRTIPKVLLIVTPLVILSYVLPTVVALAAVGGWRTWESGQFAVIAETLGGPWLGQWMFLASVASFTVIFMSYVLWWSRLAWAFAADGFLPRWLVVRHPRYGTPHRVLWLYGGLYALLALVPFNELLVVDIWLFGAYNLLLALSVVRARRRASENPGGFRIPGRWGPQLCAFTLGGTWVIVLASTAHQDRHAAMAGAVTLLSGLVIWFVAGRMRRRPETTTGNQDR